MSYRKFLVLFATIALSLATAPPTRSQSNTDSLKACETQATTFDTWAACLIDKVATPIVNQRHPANQVEVPSIAENTTSLVDQTSAPDLVGLALNLAGLKSNSDQSDGGNAATITTSAYALYAAVKGKDPMDPVFYKAHPDLRRFSFSYGRDAGDEKNAGTKGPSTVLGLKVLVLNWRDIGSHGNDKRLRKVSDDLAQSTVAGLRIRNELQNFLYQELRPILNFCDPAITASNNPALTTAANELFNRTSFFNTCLGNPRLATTIATLNPQQRNEIKAIVEKHIDDPANFMDTVAREAWTIRRAPQLSFTFQSKLRNGTGDDEYRTGILFDYGLYERLNLSVNGTFDYKDSKTIGGDTRSGRLAAEGIFQLTPNRSNFGDARPYLLSASTESKWMSGGRPTYTGQLKLTIPVPGLTGVNFPISVSVANRSDLVKEKVVRGKFGFTFDLAKLLSKKP